MSIVNGPEDQMLKGYREFARELQHLAHIEVFEVGGYWPVLATLSAVSDEVGDASSSILDDHLSKAAFHLGKANWLLACVANQYCCRLEIVPEERWARFKENFDEIKPNEDTNTFLHVLLIRLFISFGRITRIANRYELGVLNDNEANTSIALDIQEAQWAICLAIELCGKDPMQLIEVHQNEVRSFRGNSRFPPGLRSNPSYGTSLERFKELASATMCPFAKSAKVWAIGPWRATTTSGTEFVKSSEETIHRFVRVCQPEGFDGIAIEATGISSLDDLKSKTNELLRALGQLSERDPMIYPIEKREWRFALVGMDMFVTIFSPFYGSAHPRYSQDRVSSFFFLQPQLSFKAKAAREKERIRDLFSEAGQDYRPILKKIKYEAEKYIKPKDLSSDIPVRWWD